MKKIINLLMLTIIASIVFMTENTFTRGGSSRGSSSGSQVNPGVSRGIVGRGGHRGGPRGGGYGDYGVVTYDYDGGPYDDYDDEAGVATGIAAGTAVGIMAAEAADR